jgi:hypothetical protein
MRDVTLDERRTMRNFYISHQQQLPHGISRTKPGMLAPLHHNIPPLSEFTDIEE